MKDQYLGDARDYLKYHLLEELLAHVPGVKQLVCLWMLTPPDSSGEGNLAAGKNELPHLTDFLREIPAPDGRRVKHLRKYFLQRGIDYVPWGDEPPYFSQALRSAYFSGVPPESLHRALTFFDPDIGLSHQAKSAKHLSFNELREVHARLDANSLSVVYQHFWRVPDFAEAMGSKIRSYLDASVGYVAERGAALYVIPKAPSQRRAINECLIRVARAGHSRRHGLTRPAT